MDTTNTATDKDRAEILSAIELGEISNLLPQPLSAEETDALVERSKTDVGSPFEPAMLQRLAATRRTQERKADFMRLKARLKEETKVQVGVLDQDLDAIDREMRGAEGAATGQGGKVTFPDIEPWPEPIDGAELLDDIVRATLDYMAMPAEAARACALWVVYTHLYDLFEHAPRLNIRAPTKRCGKSLLRQIVGRLVLRPLSGAGITVAAVFRVMDKHHPTLLLDETDAFAKDDETLRGVFNAGFDRDEPFLRLVGDDHEPRAFDVFGPMALVGIGNLADTVEDRSVVISLQRRRPKERGKRYRKRKTPEFATLVRKIARWGQDIREALADPDPEMPEALDDRAQDKWRPLVSVADAAGGAWSDLARAAALALSGTGAEADVDNGSASLMLLADLQKLFRGDYDDALQAKGSHLVGEFSPGRDKGGRGFERFQSEALAKALGELPDRPWGTWHKGKPVSTSAVAKLLKGYGIRPGAIRWGDKVPNGYRRLQFEDAFERYLDSTAEQDKTVAYALPLGKTGFEVPTFLQPNKSGDLRAKTGFLQGERVGTSKSAKPLEKQGMLARRNLESGKSRENTCSTAPESSRMPIGNQVEGGEGGGTMQLERVMTIRERRRLGLSFAVELARG